ncbi:MAG: vitamin K epoxide reductase family protein [Chloroflexi bacterium]|nr:vitamin K epoxide reductase family protein [Chloroflexota bacterium]
MATFASSARGDRVRRLMIGLALLGLLDASYLTWLKFAHATCGVGGCDVVNSSPYAELFGIPIALFGALTYGVILFLLWIEPRLAQTWAEYARYAVFGITFFGVVYSAYLTYVEIAIIQAICPFCVVSAVTLLFLWVLAMIRVLQAAP